MLGMHVFFASERKEFTLVILAKSIESSIGKVLVEPEDGRGRIQKEFTISDNSGNQNIYVVELPSKKIKSLLIPPLASVGSYEIDSVTVASDDIRYNWDSTGTCTQKLQEHGSRAVAACSNNAPELLIQENGAMAITRLPETGMRRNLMTRLALSGCSFVAGILACLFIAGTNVSQRKESPWQQISVRMLWVAVSFLAAYQLFLVCRYGVDVPYYDEWVYFKPLALPSGLSLHWLFSSHSEHKIVFTYLMAWLNLKLFHLDFAKQLFFNSGIFFSLLLILVRMKNRSFAAGSFPFFPAFIIFLLSPLNWENLLWAFQSQIHLTLLFSLLSLHYAFDDTTSLRATLLFSIFALFAVYSFASGMAFAAVFLLMRSLFLADGISRNRIGSAAGYRSLVLGWVLVCSGAAFWFYGSIAPGESWPLTMPTQQSYWIYFFNILSLGFGFVAENPFPGVACLIYAVVPVWMLLSNREKRADAANWQITTAIVAIIVTFAAISAGRASYSTPKHYRYAEFGMLLIPFGAMAWWRAIDSAKKRLLLLSVLWGVLFLSYSSDWSIDKFQRMKQVNIYTTECIENYYLGRGDGNCIDPVYNISSPAALDSARILKVNFARRILGN
jgi:hypothetical protein